MWTKEYSVTRRMKEHLCDIRVPKRLLCDCFSISKLFVNCVHLLP